MSLFRRSQGPAATGLGAFEAKAVSILADFMEAHEPDGVQAVSLDTFPLLQDAVELGDYLDGFPSHLELAKLTQQQRNAIQARVEAELRQRNFIVVQKRQDLIPALAKAGRLTADVLASFNDLTRKVTFVEARDLAEEGRPIYTVQKDGQVVSGIHPGNALSFISVRGEA